MLQTNKEHFRTLCIVQYDPSRCKRQWIVLEDTAFISWSTTMDSIQTGFGAHPANGRLRLMERLRGHAGTPDITLAPSRRGIWLRTGTAAHTLTTVRLSLVNPRDRWTAAIFHIFWTAHARSELREQTTVTCHLVQLFEFWTRKGHWENYLQKYWPSCSYFSLMTLRYVRMEQLGSHRTDFHEILYMSIFRQSVVT
jgi:hypothetical protein